jgi:hypothetical protein
MAAMPPDAAMTAMTPVVPVTQMALTRPTW